MLGLGPPHVEGVDVGRMYVVCDTLALVRMWWLVQGW